MEVCEKKFSFEYTADNANNLSYFYTLPVQTSKNKFLSEFASIWRGREKKNLYFILHIKNMEKETRE